MPQIVNTNILSINAQRQLNKTQNMQSTAIQRLSSGLRINSAKDDAAGLAISTRFETQVRGLNQAVRNANDGISLAQTAEGSMQEMTNILQRMRELAVQSANGTNSAQDRASIQSEVDQLYDELGRIAESTEFNGVKLLDGSSKGNTFQIGANANQSIGFSIDSVTTTDLNLNGFSALSDLNGGRVASATSAIANGAITINGQALTAFGANDNAELTDTGGLVEYLNSNTGTTGVTADAYNVLEGSGGVSGVTDGTLTINGDTVGASGNMTELVSNINRDVAGVTASLNQSGGLILSNDTGADIVIDASNTDTIVSAAGLSEGTFYGFLSLSSNDGEPISIGYDEDNGGSAALLRELGFNASTGSSSVVSGEITGSFVAGTDGVQINGVSIGEVRTSTAVGATITAANIATAINAVSSETGVTADATTTIEYEAVTSVFAAGVAAGNAISINGVNLTAFSGGNTLGNVVNAINNAGVQGVVASAGTDGNLVLTSESGLDIEVSLSGAGAGALLDASDGTTAITTDTTRGSLTLTGENGVDVIVTSNLDTQSLQTSALAKLGLASQGGSSTAVGLKLDVSNVANANNAIERIDEALQKLSSSRADLGAIQNRLGSTIANLENVSQNLQAANSRIRDADFAAETSTLTKSQILQQAGISMLAQANASQQNVLSLLG